MSTHFSQKSSQKEVEVPCLKMLMCLKGKMRWSFHQLQAGWVSASSPSRGNCPVLYTLQKLKWSLPACEGLRIQFKLKGNWPRRWPSPLCTEKETAPVQISGPMQFSRAILSWIRVILGARKRRLRINGLSSVGAWQWPLAG